MAEYFHCVSTSLFLIFHSIYILYNLSPLISCCIFFRWYVSFWQYQIFCLWSSINSIYWLSFWNVLWWNICYYLLLLLLTVVAVVQLSYCASNFIINKITSCFCCFCSVLFVAVLNVFSANLVAPNFLTCVAYPEF